MNNIFMKKAAIIAVIAVTALCMSACGDTSSKNESKNADTSSATAAAEETSAAEDAAAAAESKAEEAAKTDENAEKVTVGINNYVGVTVTKIQILDSEGNVLDDLELDNGMLTTGTTNSFEITSGDDLTVRYGTEDTTIFDIKGVKTSDLTDIKLCRQENNPWVECTTKDGEVRKIDGVYVEGHVYDEHTPYEEQEADLYNDNTYDDNYYYDDNTDYNNYDDQTDYNYDGGDTGYTDNGDNGDGGCVGQDAFTF